MKRENLKKELLEFITMIRRKELCTNPELKEGKKLTKKVEEGQEQNMGSQREVEENIAHSNIIKNLKVGQAILLRQYPTKIDLVNIKYIDPDILEENVNKLEKWGYIEQLRVPSDVNKKVSNQYLN